jgi:hypothetical protein
MIVRTGLLALLVLCVIVPYPDGQPKAVAKGAVAPSWNR